MRKDELIETIHVKHRQLERYLFYFEKGNRGDFIASDRPKFGEQEMLHIEIYMDWNLKDLLSHLTDWEARFTDWVHTGLEGDVAPKLPPLKPSWEGLNVDETPIPIQLQMRSLHRVLDDFKETYAHLLDTVEAIPEADLFTPCRYEWTGQASIADYLVMCTSQHYDWAKGLIRRWRKTHAGEYLNKEIILERIRNERRRLENNLVGLSDEMMETPSLNGEWMIKDLLAHLVDWEQRFMGWYAAGLRGENPGIPAPDLGWEDIDLLNQRIYDKNRDRPLDVVREEFNASYRQMLATVESIPEEDMFTVGKYAWLGEGNLVGFILANTVNHYRWANRLVRKWLKL
jgi:hypothetical protein